MSKRNLLIAVDATPESEKAFRWACENLYRDGDVVHIMHVVPATAYDIIQSDPETAMSIENPEKQEQMQQAAIDYLTETYAKDLEDKQVKYELDVVKFMTDCDSVGKAVCERAENLACYAVVIASHNKGAIKEFFLGSVTKYCTQNCKVPVVILH